jgi:Transport and Golgi organisation 2
MADSEAMCTVVVSLAPEDRVPLLLLGVRDEFTGRPWQPPARYWPGSPLVGGRDEQAGGTWLAVHPAVPRVGCVLNARGQMAALSGRRSRGELPLRAADEGQQALRELYKDPDTLASYDPFHLVCADLYSVLLLSWDGSRAGLRDLEPATHLLTNAGHAYPNASQPTGQTPSRSDQTPSRSDQTLSGRSDQTPSDREAPPDPQAKADHFGPKFAAHRPSGDPAATIKDAWGDWLTLADGNGLPVTDPAAIIVRRELPNGWVWGTTSVSLVALAADGLRYDFQPGPADLATWYSVDTTGR